MAHPGERLPRREATPRVSRTVLDPAAFIRQSIESGEAEPAGETTIRGQRVIRIRVSSPRYSLLEPAALYFVDARTYRPVRIVIIRTFPPPDPVPFGLPLTSLTDLLVPSLGALRGGGMVVDFEEYRLLAPSVANRRMAHIRVQHPKARIV